MSLTTCLNKYVIKNTTICLEGLSDNTLVNGTDVFTTVH